MNNLTGIIEQLCFKIQNLIHLHQNLSNENSLLKKLNKELVDKLSDKELLIKELEEKGKILRLASKVNGVKTEEQSQDLKLKINEMVREINNCIAHLNS